MRSTPLLLAAWILLPMIRTGCCCSPKAVRSVFVGRGAAEAHHQAKKAKYLAGQSKTIGEKLQLSKGGVIMEQIDPKKLKAEIKYLESIEGAIKGAKKKELKTAATNAKRAAKGKPPKLSNKKPIVVAAVPPPRTGVISAVKDPPKVVEAVSEAAGKAGKNKKVITTAGKEATDKAAKAGEKTGKAGKGAKGAKGAADSAPPPGAAVSAATEVATETAERAVKVGEEVVKKKKRFGFGK